MPAEAIDLSLESERARIFAEARIIAQRLADYTQLIQEWALTEGADDAA